MRWFITGFVACVIGYWFGYFICFSQFRKEHGMNNVQLIGRLTKDPEVKYTTGREPTAVATLTVAVDRPTRSGEERKADFPRVVVWGRLAENCEKYLAKGSQVGITGRIQTGSYEKDGRRIYTTDVVAQNVEFLGARNKNNEHAQNDAPSSNSAKQYYDEDDYVAGFQSVEDDIPF